MFITFILLTLLASMAALVAKLNEQIPQGIIKIPNSYLFSLRAPYYK